MRRRSRRSRVTALGNLSNLWDHQLNRSASVRSAPMTLAGTWRLVCQPLALAATPTRRQLMLMNRRCSTFFYSFQVVVALKTKQKPSSMPTMNANLCLWGQIVSTTNDATLPTMHSNSVHLCAADEWHTSTILDGCDMNTLIKIFHTMNLRCVMVMLQKKCCPSLKD